MTTRRLILHLGDSKTGSTSIQRTLRASPRTLRAAGVLFPDPGRHDNHQLVFPHLHGTLPDDPVQLDSLGGKAGALERAAVLWDDLRRRVETEDPAIVVLSCENQFRPFDAAAIARMERIGSEIADRIEIFAYLRSPASFFLSYAQQSIKKRAEFRVLSPTRYRDTLGPLVEHGSMPVTVARFGRDALKEGDAVTDFCTRLLPAVDPAALTRGVEDNATVSAEAMQLLQDIFRGTRDLPRGFEGDRKALRKIVMDCDSRVPSHARPRLHAPVRHAIETRCADLGWLEDTFGLTFPDLGPRDMDPTEAARIHDGLRDVTDLCPVHPRRTAALWDVVTAEAQAARNPIRRLARRLGLQPVSRPHRS